MSTSVRRAACSAGATLFAAASFGLVTTGVAVAHVTANPGTAVKGSYANSNTTAHTITKATLGTIKTHNSGTPFGFTALSAPRNEAQRNS